MWHAQLPTAILRSAHFTTNMKYNRNEIGRFTKSYLNRLGIFLKKTIIISGFLTSVGWGYVAGIHTNLVKAQYVYVASTSTPAVLQRIEKCESNDEQFNKDGQVLVHVNKDGSYDIGFGQINSVWNAEATKLGYDLTKESDNKAFALYLFDQVGSSPWVSSQSCWNN